MARKLRPSAYAVPVQSKTGNRSIINVFGTLRARDWLVSEGGTDAGKRAAELQHQIAHQIRDAILLSEWGSLAEFARQHQDISYDRLRGVLSGDIWMRLEDVAEWSNLLGLEIQITVAVQERTGAS